MQHRDLMDSFSGLDDLGDAPVEDIPTDHHVDPRFIGAGESQAVQAKYREDCPKCRGRGRFISFAGRDVGPCFACDGKGYREYRTSPETRQARRDSAAAAKGRKRKAASDKATAFLKSRPDVAAWFRRQEDRGQQFGMDLQAKLFQYGKLTDKQLACIERDIAKYEAAKAERGANPSDLDLSELPSGHYAVPGGDTRLKLRVSRPRKGSRWFGYIFVDDGAVYGQRTNYGRQAPNGTYSGRLADELRAILADPRAASARYGQLTSTCGVCGRPLEDEESVKRGIGPVCAGKF